MKIKLLIVLTSCLLSLILLKFCDSYNFVLADDTDEQSAIDSAPNGLDIKNYFSDIVNPKMNGSNYRDPFTENNAHIRSKTGSSTQNTILSLASEPSDTGAIWSDPDTGNAFDISKKQIISAWLYFGPYNMDKNKEGEGIALVLQNDPRGAYAMGAGREGLGVDGYDKTTFVKGLLTNSVTYPTSQYLVNTAVSNSVALEFDSHTNSSNTKDSAPIRYKSGVYLNYDYSLDAFDTTDLTIKAPAGFPANTSLGAGDSGFGHISLTFPGTSESYAFTNRITSENNDYQNFEKATSLFHTENTPAYLINGTDSQGNTTYWHHVTLTWTPEDSKLHYAFNDKDIDGTTVPEGGGGKLSKRIDKNIQLNPAIFNLPAGQSKIRWGFTGANTATSGVPSKLVVLESIPALLNATADSTIYDQTLDKTITNDSTDYFVNDGDNVDLNYNLKYDIGNISWQGITATITLPPHFTPIAGNIGTITYGNGTVEDLADSDIKDGVLTHKLTKPIDTNAKIVIHGKVDNKTLTDYHITSKPAKFEGTNDITSTATPPFTIMFIRTWKLNLKQQNPIDLLYQEENTKLDLPTDLSYDEDHNFLKDDPIHYDIKINNYDFTYDATAQSETSTSNTPIPLKQVIDAKDSNLFWNIFQMNTTQTIYVTAKDKDGITSNTIPYTVNVLQNHLLKLSVSPNIDFQTIVQSNSKKLIKRQNNNFNLSVISLREPWQLTATATLLADNKTDFKGNLVFKNNQTTQNLLNSPIDIYEDSTSSDTEKTTNISGNWSNDSGILLKQTNQNEAGQYQGTITWTLGDYPVL
ncbi:hypothetical protein [Companilactobacillus halodurans]|uniref:WxL domain-containing protein n=1 Tax=Companilactobacillus halodurans TaxID=2584183 RepID=A0A5P0ZYI0_9LACO|nr:hypothetical protein [Companilactobacillus halodurans]MQS76645.1 hypothetical protein [Companilactobacillus halodurans]MQS97794.1 hypothetical protein [Companilactobacillus halodurans]